MHKVDIRLVNLDIVFILQFFSQSPRLVAKILDLFSSCVSQRVRSSRSLAGT